MAAVQPTWPVTYDPSAPEPVRWLRFLRDLWPDDRESHRLLQEWFGLCLVPDTSYQKALMIVGPRCSGKSTIARVLTALSGDRRSTTLHLGELDRPFALQALLGKFVAVVPEGGIPKRKAARPAIARFLKILKTDRMIVERRLLPMIEAEIPVRFTFLLGEAPWITEGLVSRLLALQIQAAVRQKDRHLPVQLVAELPGIRRWSVEGLQRLRARGTFIQPHTALELLSLPGNTRNCMNNQRPPQFVSKTTAVCCRYLESAGVSKQTAAAIVGGIIEGVSAVTLNVDDLVRLCRITDQAERTAAVDVFVRHSIMTATKSTQAALFLAESLKAVKAAEEKG